MVHGDRCVVWIVWGMLCGVYELWCRSDVLSLLCANCMSKSVEAVL